MDDVGVPDLGSISDADFYREFNRRRLCHNRAPRPTDLRSMDDLPRDGQIVVLWVSDPNVAIEFYPVTAYNYPEFNKPMWWSGIPGKYQRLGRFAGEDGWIPQGWTPLPSTLPNVTTAEPTPDETPGKPVACWDGVAGPDGMVPHPCPPSYPAEFYDADPRVCALGKLIGDLERKLWARDLLASSAVTSPKIAQWVERNAVPMDER